LRGKIHSSHGGRKAHLNFELKGLRPPEAARVWRVLDFKVQMRSGLPCEKWEGAAVAGLPPSTQVVSMSSIPIKCPIIVVKAPIFGQRAEAEEPDSLRFLEKRAAE